MKKILAMIITLLLSVSILGCNQQTTVTYEDDNFLPTGDKIVKEKIELTFFVPQHPLHNSEGFNDMTLFKIMEEVTNIHINWVYGPVATFDEKKSLALQNYENYDAFFLWNTLEDQVQLSQFGVIRPLEDLFSTYAPNYYSILSNNEYLEKISTLDDGHIYSNVVINDVPRDQTFKQYINNKWLSNLGLSVPTTVDEYYEVLKAFKNQDPNQNGIPDEIPLSSAQLYQTRNFLMSAFGFLSTGIEVRNDDVVFVPSTNNYRAYLEYTHMLYDEGLLDNSTFTMSNSDLAAKGSVIGSFDSAAAYLVAGVQRDEDYVALSPLTSDINSNKMWLGFNASTPTGIMIPTATPYYREILRWLDFLYTDRGIKLQAFGEEGVDFTWDNDNQDSFTFNVPENVNMEAYRGTITPAVGLGAIAYWNKDFVLKDNNVLTQKINDDVQNAGYLDYLVIPYPQVIFTQTETSQIAIISTDLDVYMKIFEEKVITGKLELDDDSWQEHLDNLEQLGYQQYLEVHQAAYDRYMDK